MVGSLAFIEGFLQEQLRLIILITPSPDRGTGGQGDWRDLEGRGRGENGVTIREIFLLSFEELQLCLCLFNAVGLIADIEEFA